MRDAIAQGPSAALAPFLDALQKNTASAQ
jgi:hypothetical protein